jgi:hypothetical protein
MRNELYLLNEMALDRLSWHAYFFDAKTFPYALAAGNKPIREYREVAGSRQVGSGSLEKDGPLSIVAMEKEEQTGGRSMTTDLENDNVMRTKRARRWRKVLFQRSTWAVSPVSFPTAVCWSEGDHCLRHRPEVGSAMPCAVGGWNGFPQPLARLAGSDHPRRTPPLDASCDTRPSTPRSRWLF